MFGNRKCLHYCFSVVLTINFAYGKPCPFCNYDHLEPTGKAPSHSVQEKSCSCRATLSTIRHNLEQRSVLRFINSVTDTSPLQFSLSTALSELHQLRVKQLPATGRDSALSGSVESSSRHKSSTLISPGASLEQASIPPSEVFSQTLTLNSEEQQWRRNQVYYQYFSAALAQMLSNDLEVTHSGSNWLQILSHSMDAVNGSGTGVPDLQSAEDPEAASPAGQPPELVNLWIHIPCSIQQEFSIHPFFSGSSTGSWLFVMNAPTPPGNRAYILLYWNGSSNPEVSEHLRMHDLTRKITGYIKKSTEGQNDGVSEPDIYAGYFAGDLKK